MNFKTDHVTCECGAYVSKKKLKRHTETNKHKKAMGEVVEKQPSKRNERVDCPCGSSYIAFNKSHHLKSNTHRKILDDYKHLEETLRKLELSTLNTDVRDKLVKKTKKLMAKFLKKNDEDKDFFELNDAVLKYSLLAA